MKYNRLVTLEQDEEKLLDHKSEYLMLSLIVAGAI